ncbi:unnamed protein product, partial [Symbiodinium sp. CCMP2456]
KILVPALPRRCRVRATMAATKVAEEAEMRERLLSPAESSDGLRKRKDAKVASAEDAERSEVLALQAARDKMQEELHRMQYVGESLEGSSSTIGRTQTAMQEYDSKLASAAKALGQLKRRMEEDSRYIWWSFYFFLAVVAYIVLRRLKVFKMMHYGASWTAWLGAWP